MRIFRKLLPDFDNMKKRILVTHADLDHCGILSLFDEIYAGNLTKECLELEHKSENGFRERNPLHKPYVSMKSIRERAVIFRNRPYTTDMPLFS